MGLRENPELEVGVQISHLNPEAETNLKPQLKLEASWSMEVECWGRIQAPIAAADVFGRPCFFPLGFGT